MAKKRRTEQKPGSFQNNPFTSLKGITARPRIPVAPAGPKVDAEDADDAGLFARSVKGARPIDRSEEAIEAGPPDAASPASPKKTSDDEEEQGLFLKAMTQIGAAAVPAMKTAEEDLDEVGHHRSASSRMRQLKKGTIRISQELDLHGSLRDEALRRLQQFVAGAYARGDRAVLVITGKGINSPEGPVLPGAVSDWLRGPGKGMVAEFHPAPRDKGGSGAVVVFLRTRP